MTFLDELRQQRWDDHRYYHHNRVNQWLHLMSACCFLVSYVVVFSDPVMAVMVGWLLAMILRQIGHFFFEPKTYDEVNQASHEYKESVKVGYNLNRKVWLLTIWVSAPLLLFVDPTLFGAFDPVPVMRMDDYIHHTAYMWLVIGIGAVIFRSVHLFFLMSVQSGLVWASKILTDPFHDVMIYYKAPYYLLKGELYDDCSEWYDDSVKAPQ